MKDFTLWEKDSFKVITLKNPHIPYSEGHHIIVKPKKEIPNAWTDIKEATSTFCLASEVCKIMEKLNLAPWFNIQANGNWGLLPGRLPHFHVHVYSRQKKESWGKPVVLPESPDTFQNEPMAKALRDKLTNVFMNQLS